MFRLLIYFGLFSTIFCASLDLNDFNKPKIQPVKKSSQRNVQPIDNFLPNTPTKKCKNSPVILRTLELIKSMMSQNMERQAHMSYMLNLLTKIIEKNTDNFNLKEKVSMDTLLEALEHYQGPTFEEPSPDMTFQKGNIAKRLTRNKKSYCADALLKISRIASDAYDKLTTESLGYEYTNKLSNMVEILALPVAGNGEFSPYDPNNSRQPSNVVANQILGLDPRKTMNNFPTEDQDNNLYTYPNKEFKNTHSLPIIYLPLRPQYINKKKNAMQFPYSNQNFYPGTERVEGTPKATFIQDSTEPTSFDKERLKVKYPYNTNNNVKKQTNDYENFMFDPFENLDFPIDEAAIPIDGSYYAWDLEPNTVALKDVNTKNKYYNTENQPLYEHLSTIALNDVNTKHKNKPKHVPNVFENIGVASHSVPYFEFLWFNKYRQNDKNQHHYKKSWKHEIANPSQSYYQPDPYTPWASEINVPYQHPSHNNGWSDDGSHYDNNYEDPTIIEPAVYPAANNWHPYGFNPNLNRLAKPNEKYISIEDLTGPDNDKFWAYDTQLWNMGKDFPKVNYSQLSNNKQKLTSKPIGTKKDVEFINAFPTNIVNMNSNINKPEINNDYFDFKEKHRKESIEKPEITSNNTDFENNQPIPTATTTTDLIDYFLDSDTDQHFPMSQSPGNYLPYYHNPSEIEVTTEIDPSINANSYTYRPYGQNPNFKLFNDNQNTDHSQSYNANYMTKHWLQHYIPSETKIKKNIKVDLNPNQDWSYGHNNAYNLSYNQNPDYILPYYQNPSEIKIDANSVNIDTNQEYHVLPLPSVNPISINQYKNFHHKKPSYNEFPVPVNIIDDYQNLGDQNPDYYRPYYQNGNYLNPVDQNPDSYRPHYQNVNYQNPNSYRPYYQNPSEMNISPNQGLDYNVDHVPYVTNKYWPNNQNPTEKEETTTITPIDDEINSIFAFYDRPLTTLKPNSIDYTPSFYQPDGQIVGTVEEKIKSMNTMKPREIKYYVDPNTGQYRPYYLNLSEIQDTGINKGGYVIDHVMSTAQDHGYQNHDPNNWSYDSYQPNFEIEDTPKKPEFAENNDKSPDLVTPEKPTSAAEYYPNVYNNPWNEGYELGDHTNQHWNYNLNQWDFNVQTPTMKPNSNTYEINIQPGYISQTYWGQNPQNIANNENGLFDHKNYKYVYNKYWNTLYDISTEGYNIVNDVSVPQIPYNQGWSSENVWEPKYENSMEHNMVSVKPENYVNTQHTNAQDYRPPVYANYPQAQGGNSYIFDPFETSTGKSSSIPTLTDLNYYPWGHNIFSTSRPVGNQIYELQNNYPKGNEHFIAETDITTRPSLYPMNFLNPTDPGDNSMVQTSSNMMPNGEKLVPLQNNSSDYLVPQWNYDNNGNLSDFIEVPSYDDDSNEIYPTDTTELDIDDNVETEVQVINLIKQKLEEVEKKAKKQNEIRILNLIQKIRQIISIDVTRDKYLEIFTYYNEINSYLKANMIGNPKLNLIINRLYKLPDQKNLELDNRNHYVEMTYLVRRPRPIIIYPYYYVKYKVPVHKIDKMIKEDPNLIDQDEKLHIDLLKTSEIAERSSALNKLSERDLLSLTIGHGDVINTKLVIGSTSKTSDVSKNENYYIARQNNELPSDKETSTDINKLRSAIQVTIEQNDKPYDTISIADRHFPIEDRNGDQLNDLYDPFKKLLPLYKLKQATDKASATRRQMHFNDLKAEPVITQVIMNNNEESTVIEENNPTTVKNIDIYTLKYEENVPINSKIDQSNSTTAKYERFVPSDVLMEKNRNLRA